MISYFIKTELISQYCRCKVLCYKLRNDVIKPLNVFFINNATHQSNVTTIITFVIILLQFKVSDQTGPVKLIAESKD